MPKKKPAKEIPAGETLHFRPGPALGTLLAKFADEQQLSRGEAAKRLLGLAVRGLTIQCYGVIAELANCIYANGDFDQACDQVFVAVVNDDERTQKAGQKPLDEEDKLRVAREVVRQYRIARGLDEPAEQQRQILYEHRRD